MVDDGVAGDGEVGVAEIAARRWLEEKFVLAIVTISMRPTGVGRLV
ncbi:MAG: hypothetical protein NC453_19440 [Muribaculum sp.]|nr:hypothetical protein [Muribaculum sp.]